MTGLWTSPAARVGAHVAGEAAFRQTPIRAPIRDRKFSQTALCQTEKSVLRSAPVSFMSNAPVSASRPSCASPWAIGILLVFTLFTVALVAIRFYAGPVEDVEAKRAGERAAFLHKVRSRDAALLTSYGETNAASPLARIPVNLAAKMAIDRLQAKPVREADRIEPPPPPVPAAAPASAPKAAAKSP